MDIKVLASGSSGNCYMISDGSTDLLLDAGISIKRIQIGCDFNLSRIAGCLVTHSHGDHSKAVKDLLRKCVDVWMPEGEMNELGIQDCRRLHSLNRVGDDEYTVFLVGTFDILPFRTEHDTPEPVAYHDDAQVVDFQFRKFYSLRPRLVITIQESAPVREVPADG